MDAGISKVEATVTPSEVENQAEMQRDITTSTMVECPDPIHTARAKALIGFEHSNQPQMGSEHSRVRPHLLF
jgi:hypothetical protein